MKQSKSEVNQMKVNREKIRVAMARTCMSSGEISEAAGLSRQTVNNVLYGRNVRPCTLGKVARVLGVDVTEILEEVNE